MGRLHLNLLHLISYQVDNLHASFRYMKYRRYILIPYNHLTLLYQNYVELKNVIIEVLVFFRRFQYILIHSRRRQRPLSQWLLYLFSFRCNASWVECLQTECTAADSLKAMLVALDFPKPPPGITSFQLFSKVENKVALEFLFRPRNAGRF